MQSVERKISVTKMADLTKDRMSEKSPLTNFGADLIGLFVVKGGQKEVKVYGVVCTCLPSRAIHNEVVHCLSTDSFIISLRRFVGCRGDIGIIRSDNGSSQQSSLVPFRKIASR